MLVAKFQPRSQGLSSLPPLSLRKTTMEAEKRDPGNEVGKVPYLSSQVGHTNPGLLVVKFAKYLNEGRSVKPLQPARVLDEDHDIAFTKEYFDNVRKEAEPFGDPLLRTIIVLRGPEWSIERVVAINYLRKVYNIMLFFAFGITITFTGFCCTMYDICMHSHTNSFPCIETLQLETFCVPHNQSLFVAYTLWCHFVQMSQKNNNGCCLGRVACAEMTLLGPKPIYAMTITAPLFHWGFIKMYIVH